MRPSRALSARNESVILIRGGRRPRLPVIATRLEHAPQTRRSVATDYPMSLLQATAAELISSLRSGKVSSVEVTTAYLDQIGAQDAKVKAFLHVDRDAALAA